MITPDLDVIFDEAGGFAQPAVYTPKATGRAADVSALLTIVDQSETQSPLRSVRAAAIAVARADEIPDPQPGDTLTVGGVVWEIVQLAASDGQIHTLDLQRQRRPNFRP